MEEDIKILEEILEPFREQNRKGKKLILDITGIKYKHYEALENLLTRYKQLEEENKHLLITGAKQVADIDINYIPKSKIKEKIEEIKLNHKDDCLVIHEIEKDAKIRVLQELLEED